MKPAVGTLKLIKKYGKYFLRKPALPTNRFVIFGSGRSGSTLLVNLLNSSDQVFCDGEILNRDPVAFPNLFIKVQASRCSQPVYGFKLLDYQLKERQKIKEPEDFLINLHREGWKFIYLTRRNKLDYALSILNAFHRKSFHHRGGDGELTRQKLKVDIEDLLYWIKQGEYHTRHYDGVLEDIPHLKLTYEDNLRNSQNHQETADRVFSFLELPKCNVESDLVKLMPARPIQMVDNQDDVIEALKQTDYAHFLDPI